MTDEQRAERIVKRYNELKDKKVRLEERRAMYLEQLKKEYNISSVEELEAAIDKTEKDLDKVESKLKPMLDRLEEDLGL